MNLANRILLPSLALNLALFGCRPSTSETDGNAHDDVQLEAGIQVHENRGLLVSPATAAAIGLKIADVAGHPLSTTLSFAAQVYGRSAPPLPERSNSTVSQALATASLSPAQAARLSQGQSVSAHCSAADRGLPAQVIALNHTLLEATGQVEALVAITDPDQSLTSGTFITIAATCESDPASPGIPRSALFRTTDGNFVYTVSGDHLVRTPVEVGVTNEDFAEVRDGLYTGDQIVVQPVMTLWLAELQSLRAGKACADGH